jgi:hypothetical protein
VRRFIPVCVFALLCAGLVQACGDDGGGDATRTAPTQPVAPIPSPMSNGGDATPAGSAPTVRPTQPDGSATDEPRSGPPLEFLGTLTLQMSDVPDDFALRSSFGATTGEIAAAQIAIPVVAAYMEDTPVQGAWALLYTRDQPEAGLSSIVYQFPSAEEAAGYVNLVSGLTNSDYPGATSVEPVAAETVGEKSVLMRYRLTGSRTLELTWAQGARAGQVLLRYVGDTESEGDVELLLALARAQAQRMADAPA